MAKGTIVSLHKDQPICFVEDDELKEKVLIRKTKSLNINDKVVYQRISSQTGLVGIKVKKI
ncbi:hypothetical protein ASE74_19755 [Pedobacter sp. Leaf216]|uniref:hypothetical protein n=1 Tax=Pedobacter sp. Leaf216 TaxID=1735684 RepID=UPI000700191D|nr:hypothetical protein [Pedobacter sp. Leaf216]KQM76289.1 hypothetical protein ASE74_19755 [Pedobacter sp. Leaf216]